MWIELSAQKRLLFRLALGAVAGMSCCVLLSALLVHNIGLSLWVKISAVVLFVAALGLCIPLLQLLNEYTRLARPTQTAWKRLSALKWVEIKALTAACPSGIRLTVIAVGALALFQCLRLGHFAVVHPGIAAPDVIGILSGATFFYSLCIPFLLAAAFTRGSYAEQFRGRRV